MSKERFEELISNDYPFYEGDGIWEGLQIIKKYLPEEKCTINTYYIRLSYCHISKICELISEDEVIKLGKFGWCIDADNLLSYQIG